MIVLFYLVVIAGLAFFMTRRRQFDFVSAGFFGMMAYFLPGFFGTVMNPYLVNEFPIEPIGWQTYLVWIIALGITMLAGAMYNPPKPECLPEINTDAAFDMTLLALLAVSLIGSIIIGGDALISPDKNDVLAVQGRVFILFSTVTQIAFVCFALQAKRLPTLVAGLCIAFLMYIGYRLELAISAISILTVLAFRNGILKYMRPKLLLPALLFIAITFSYKFVSFAMRAGRYDIVVNTIFSGDFASTVFLKSEPFVTQAILNEAILRDYTVPPESILFGFIGLIPLSNSIFGFDDSALGYDFQQALFANLDYGLASNIYANFYSALGWPGILLFCVMQATALVLISKALRKPTVNNYVRLALVLIGSFMAFYIQRNDLAYSITLVDRYIYVTLIVWLLSRVVAAFTATGAPSLSSQALTDQY